MKTLKLMIADSHSAQRRELISFINSLDMNLLLAGSFATAGALEKAIDARKPDIVIIDIDIPYSQGKGQANAPASRTGLDIIKSCRLKAPSISFIIFTECSDFRSVRSALRLGVSDYILKPLDSDELSLSLISLCESIRKKGIEDMLRAADHAMRKKLISEAIFDEIPHRQPSLERINQKYNCNLAEGEFQVLFIKLDSLSDPKNFDYSIPVGNMDEIVSRHFASDCNEVLLGNKRDGLIAILNYPQGSHDKIRELLSGLYVLIGNYFRRKTGIRFTLCISSVTEQFTDCGRLIFECRSLEWLRIFLGTDRIITWEDLPQASPDSLIRIEGYRQALFTAIDKADTEAFVQNFRLLFKEPSDVLFSGRVFSIMWDLRKYFISKYGDTLDPTIDSDTAFNKLSLAMHSALSPSQYESNVLEVYEFLMNIVRNSQPLTDERTLRLAYAYVNRHYGEKISLEKIAESVNLSPGYFSNYFNKAAGMHFSDYLASVRVRAACDLLLTTNKNISEIASETGFSDARYFSKVFRRSTGQTPSQYRNSGAQAT